MKKKKSKKINGLLILLVTISTLSSIFIPNLVTEAENGEKTLYQALNSGARCKNGNCGDIANAYAYEISIWSYEKGKTPKQVTKPILIYNPVIMYDFTIEDGAVPSSYNDLKTTNYGFQQIVDFEHDHFSYGNTDNGFSGLNDNVNSSPQNGNKPFYNPDDGSIINVPINNQFAYSLDVNNPNYTCIFVDKSTNSPKVVISNAKYSGRTGYTFLYQSFMTNVKKIKYLKKDIDLSRYLEIIEKDDLNGSNGQAYIDNFIREELSGRDGILSHFKLDLYNHAKDVDNYYFVVEPVERVLQGTKNNSQKYLIGNGPLITDPPISYDGSFEATDEYWIANRTCTSTCYDERWTNVGCQEVCKSGVDTDGYEYRGIDSDECSNSSSYRQKKVRTARACTSDECRIWRIDNYTLSEAKAGGCGRKQGFYLYGREYEGYSTLRPSREMNSGSAFLQRAVNLCSNNAHCVLNDDGSACKVDENGKRTYQYYIGPDLDRAWVGTNGNPYIIRGMENGVCTGNVSQYEGVKHIYLESVLDPERGCKQVCGNFGNKSDGLLQCAENYCDSLVDYNLQGNPRIRKKNCIINNCGYVYGKDSTGAGDKRNFESINSCNNANPYKGQEKLLTDSKSNCNSHVATSNLMQKEKGVTVSCKGDRVTDFDYNDTNDTTFDQRTYINTACKETTTFEYDNLETEARELKPGSPINYYVNQKGERKCTYFFNLEQWKFDYATIPSKDLDRRKRLKYIYTTFNHAYDKSYDPKTSNRELYDKDFEDNHDGEIEVEKYDIGKTEVKSYVEEIVENKKKKSDTELLTRQNEKENIVYNNIAREKIYSYKNNVKIDGDVNRYESISTATATYRYGKRCLETDGTAKVYTPDGDVCYTTKEGPKKAKNVYYTDIKATYDKDFSNANYKHSIYTTATVGIEALDGDLYYRNDESCRYTLNKPLKGPGCVIKITEEEGTKLLGNDVYEGGNVKAKVIVINEEGLEKSDRINEIKMAVNGEQKMTLNPGTSTEKEENKPEEEIVINIKNNNNSREDFKIVGTVTTRNGLVSTCEEEIVLLKHSGCEAKCSINKINENLYEIKTEKANSVFKSTLLNMEKTRVEKTTKENKYYVAAPEEIKEKDMLIGYVEKGNCNEYCYLPLDPDKEPKGQRCTKLYKPAELGKITEYCNANYTTDLDNYKSVDECIAKCSLDACPQECRIEENIKEYCKNNALKLGFKNESECLNRCYCPYAEDGYLFRPIHNNDPFPYSSNSPHTQGNRGIGKNWYGRESIITNDREDETSVTGENANKEVEYIMELNIDDIRKIRRENEKEGKEAYTKLIYSSQKKDVGEYKSKLLNETLARDNIFVSKMNGKNAKYMPGNDN